MDIRSTSSTFFISIKACGTLNLLGFFVVTAAQGFLLTRNWLEYFQVIYRILQIVDIICRYFAYRMEKNSRTAVKLATKNKSIFKLFILIIYSSVSDPDSESEGKNDPQK
jgi:hypothetical protein